MIALAALVGALVALNLLPPRWLHRAGLHVDRQHRCFLLGTVVQYGSGYHCLRLNVGWRSLYWERMR